MAIAQSVAEILKSHVTLEVEGIDRMYLNLYVPRLQHERGVSNFFRYHRGHKFASSALMGPITHGFVSTIETFVQAHGVALITFEKGERKDDVVKPYFADFEGEEGVVVVGKAQEKTRVLRTVKRRNATTGKTYVWLTSGTAMVNHYYFYVFDRDFGPLFVKFCSYFPYNGKVCLNGHEYAKRQLEKRGIDYEALDNGVLRCAEPRRLQKICDGWGSHRSPPWCRSGSGACRSRFRPRTGRRVIVTPCTINNTRDFDIGKGLHNLAALRRVGFQANRRLLDVERISHDCHIGEDAWTKVTRPIEVAGQRGSALRFDDPAVHALLGTLVILRLLPRGFANKDLRQNWAQLLGQAPSAITPGRMTYQLRRLRLHGMIERIPKTHRYRVTEPGMRIALFFTRTLARLLRPGLSQILPQAPPGDHRLRRDFDRLQASIDSWIDEANMAA